ncbi:hypothetical protein HOLleu_18734 [Holothuria leucospilota]|uniref:Uncharacterized protein n=1 Tax=Holothuria leucospilota TaxID=206669 RepID=A0A9Q1C3R8_HOLLE|nr:hypothetical protein HOLleu_18734 [Holothuria leucospilota]
MCYRKRKNSIIFGGGQRSSGVTGGQTLKTMLTRYLKMCYGGKMNAIMFGGGQRSCRVTEGQTLKMFLTRYLKIGSLNKFHT